jgi:hypothetical protein
MTPEQIHCLRAYLEPELSSAAEDHNLGLVTEEFLEVCRLNAGVVVGSGLSPVPLPSATGPQFRSATCPSRY